jgi:hypothetical protein
MSPEPPTLDAVPALTVLRVRMNRRRHLLTIAISLPMTCLLSPLFVSQNEIDGLAGFILGLVYGVPAGLAGGSIALLLRSTYLTYDASTRTLRGPSHWRINTNYPRAGYDRVEYSPYDARLYEVRADGKRRRLFFRRWVANQQDWRVLVDLLLAERPARRQPTV